MRSIYLTRRQIYGQGKQNETKSENNHNVNKTSLVVKLCLLILSNDVISLATMYDYINNLYFRLSKGIAIYQIIYFHLCKQKSN